MIADSPDPKEDDFVALMAACDEALAAGTQPAIDETDLTAEFRLRRQRDLACLALLDLLRPDRQPRVNTPLPANAGAETLAGRPLGHLGRFQLRRRIGRGGYGIVYLAYDPTLGREVALKVPRAPSLDSPELRARFRHEARAAASLEHPNIVPVHEAGEFGAVCYIASAYCPGETLAQWLSGQTQPVSGNHAAALIATLADAVQHAHNRGVLHRDLKPSNILLQKVDSRVYSKDSGNSANAGASTDYRLLSTEYNAKITDFGLAKFLASPGERQTHSGEIVGTPWYMAPEQAEGKTREITTAADIYALGTMLYELLTGRPPFRGDTVLAILEQVRWHEPTPPRRLRPGIPRDLDTVCLKCLQKDPDRRYGSAHALAEDLRRFLSGEPVQARPVSVFERGSKWARRRPALAASLTVAAVAIVGLLVGTMWNNKLLRDARDHAEQERLRAALNFQAALQAVDRMLTEVGHKRLANQRGFSSVRQKLLHDALIFYEQFMKLDSDSPAVRREAGQVAVHLARVHGLLGKHVEAEQVLTQAISIQEALRGEFPNEPGYQADLAHTYDRYGLLLHSRGRSSEAESAYENARALLEPLVANFPEHHEYASILASVSQDVGVLRDETGRPKDAEQGYLRAVGLYQKLRERFPDVPDYAKRWASAQHNFAHVLMLTGRSPQAEEMFAEAIAMQEKLLAQFPDVTDYQETLARSHYNRGRLYRMTNRPAPAEQASDRAIALQKKLVDDFPEVPDYRLFLSGCYTERARMLHSAGRLQDSLTAAREAAENQEKLAAAFPKVPRYRQGLGIFCLNWGTALLNAGENVEAGQAYQRAQGVFQALVNEYPAVPDYRSELAVAVHALADVHLRRGALADAELLLDQAAKHQLAALGLNPNYQPFRIRLFQTYEVLAKTLIDMKSLDDAAKLAEELARTDPGHGQGHYAAALVLARCAGLAAGEPNDRARVYAARSMELLKDAIRLNYPDVSRVNSDKELDPLRGRPDFQELIRNSMEKSGG